MPSKDQILEALSSVMDPDLGRDIVSLGFIKNLNMDGGKVSFDLELTTPACPVKDQMKEQSENAVRAVEGVESVELTLTAQVRQAQGLPEMKPLPGVKHLVPVASGKGGVGKSTVSANLAVALAKSGAKVGLMDLDIYGPSIPTIMGITSPPQIDGERIHPPERHGVKVMSMGFFLDDDQAVIWRGPMLVKMIDEFLGNVEWGELDYMIIDLPPGTGDIQLSLCQKLPLTGAVIVSTPQDVALKVAKKAISLFGTLKTPVLGMVENMSYHHCSHCGEREEIFGNSGARDAAEKLNFPFLGELPLATAIREQSDSGVPILISEPESPHSKSFEAIASQVAAQASIRAMDEQSLKISF
ncbi:MAG: Mrp/NBP35 family ATP-binding protein [Candidatus Krumholzibacteria bacterium]|jgi:ATP-binding protein involved in chromosome partitioning|nr:Mrp/NBP35 family ATP-binding protein [Candidatus Krumholzibacteria bacterium]MDP6669604.1 Mrp/NBP35 family ATP-binding protein [Candidatus Krumholzibacteria bacterium]MDP6798144.1 Mrp/NBP35 family ATP-binding protein [Candidatus Krumholzibacteria bacterium]MDP7022009.1 Mrp/NBP35 family ATP-binding protein [Candidatus Krumholzibacteria bacterium]